MPIIYHEKSKTFHLYNDEVSYIFTILKNNQLGQLYYGQKIKDREDFTHLFELRPRAMSVCTFERDLAFSLNILNKNIQPMVQEICVTRLLIFCKLMEVILQILNIKNILLFKENLKLKIYQPLMLKMIRKKPTLQITLHDQVICCGYYFQVILFMKTIRSLLVTQSL